MPNIAVTKTLTLFLLLAFALPSLAQRSDEGSAQADYNLPELGDASSSKFSLEQEHELGRAWLKAFRGRVHTVDDPLMQDYLEDLIYRLARHSALSDKRLELVIIDNRALNAFAVPGGVVGVHNGMLLYAENEAQLAGVLGHELAHLSQRHFVRSIDKQRAGNLSMMAGLLAGIVLAATTGSDAGIAAIATGQAAAMQSQLRFSREHEQEADRIGMQTLSKAGMDPNGIPSMFEIMNRRLRFNSNRPPEFLLTHPLTESRISDSANRARQYPRNVYTDNLNFQLMKKRAELSLASNKRELLNQWQYEQKNKPSEASSYGVVIALMANDEWQQADEQLKPLLTDDPNRIAYLIANANILAGQRDFGTAVEQLRKQLALNPNNNALTMTLADLLQRAGRAPEAEELLVEQSKHRPEDPALWYQLAEVHGLAGNILGVHTARAEYFILRGFLDSAEKQLHYAWPLTEDNKVARHRLSRRIKDLQELRDTLKKF
ncbi:MAG: putative Zn-dependent protease [Paracoccaceae bacterium]|jgi:predicted Zn-dependent protease